MNNEVNSVEPKLLKHGNTEPSLAYGQEGVETSRCNNSATSTSHPKLGEDIVRYSLETRRGWIKSQPTTDDRSAAGFSSVSLTRSDYVNSQETQGELQERFGEEL